MKDIYQDYDAVQLATDEDFIRWVKSSTPEDEAGWKNWLDQNPHKQAEVDAARSLVKNIRFKVVKPEVDTDKLWNRIQLSKDEPATVKTIRGRRRFIFGITGAVAAAIALMLFIVFGIDQPIRVRTDYQQHLSVALPDQSEVQLNAGTTLSYDESGREIELEGEAFFTVKTGRTFTVTTDQGQVKVLGTQFNVFSREGRFQVKCTEGRVRVTIPGDPAGVILTKGMSCKLGEGGQLVTETLSGLKAEVAWLDDIYRFDNQPLREVFAELERQFDVDIEAAESVLSINHVGSFAGSRLDSALFQVCYPHNLKPSIEGKKVSITEADTE